MHVFAACIHHTQTTTQRCSQISQHNNKSGRVHAHNSLSFLTEHGEYIAGLSAESAHIRLLETRLTAEEKLLLAQERRGKRLPHDDNEKQRFIAAGHVAHFGIKPIVAHIDRAGYWWPSS